MKKVHLFYLVEKIIDTDKYPGVISDRIQKVGDYNRVLYAYTPSKTIANEFKLLRNMDLFDEIIVETTDDDYNDFYEENIELLLEYHIFKTQDKTNKSLVKTSLNVLCTLNESDHILYYADYAIYDIFYIYKDIIRMINVEIFSEKILNIIYSAISTSLLDSFINECFIPADDSYFKNVDDVDEVSLFINIFKNTLKMI